MILAPIENGFFFFRWFGWDHFSQRLNFTPIVKLASINVLKKIKIKTNDEIEYIKSGLEPSLEMVISFYAPQVHYHFFFFIRPDGNCEVFP